MHFHAIKSILTLLLLNLSICSAMLGQSSGTQSSGYNGAQIKSAKCRDREHSASKLYEAVIAGTRTVDDLVKSGIGSAVAKYRPKNGEHIALTGPYYVYPFWERKPIVTGQDVVTFARDGKLVHTMTEEDVVIFTTDGKLAKVAVHFQLPSPRGPLFAEWEYEDCTLLFA